MHLSRAAIESATRLDRRPWRQWGSAFYPRPETLLGILRKKIEDLRTLGAYSVINGPNQQKRSLESIRRGSHAYTLGVRRRHLTSRIPKNDSGKREHEVAGLNGELLIGDDFLVARLGLGTMRLTGKGIWGEPPDRSEAIRVVRRAVELGVNFIDTADAYGPDVSEGIIADALYPYPEGVVIATKGGLERPGPSQWVENGKPEHLKAACEGSLRRLRLDRIDLYQLHRIDPKVPMERQLGALKDLQGEGKIKHIGLSEVSVRQLHNARTIVSVASVQNRYSVTDRGSEDVLGYCEQHDIVFIPWFPLAAGQLTGADSPLRHVAARKNLTPSQVALAWLLARSPVILPIPGTSKVTHVVENVAAASVGLTEDDINAVNQILPLDH
jgi:pyridoxine 4-dehydrogenase